MATNFEHSVEYPFSTGRLWELITGEQYWNDLMEATNAGHGSVESVSAEGDELTVTTKQGVGAENLPSVITKVRPGDLEIPRSIVYRRAGDRITGRMEASVTGAPAKIFGDIVISGDPAVARYEGRAEVGIPFVGGKIEKAVIEQVEQLLDAERDATVDFQQR
ncbi:DUF2505 domain-containing protein [Gordonia sp. VNK21]|uniref:DUF2505 domain-containing protein n=1 Tax=Gordonia sp. VNK21 TaxID=3382483 RepID=UPI0038D40358